MVFLECINTKDGANFLWKEIGTFGFWRGNMDLAAVRTTYNNINIYANKTTKQSTASFLLDRTSDNSDSILDYYHDLCKNFPNISFRLEDMEISLKNTNNPPNLGYNNSFNQVGNNFGSLGQCSIIIDKKVIENMQKDTVYKEIIYSYIENLESQQVGYQQHAAQEGMSCFAHVLEDNNGELAPSTLYGHGSFSTEEEVRRIWNMETYNKEIAKSVEQLKTDMIDIYLAMLEKSERTKEKIFIEMDDSEKENVREKEMRLESKNIEIKDLIKS